MFSDTLKLVSHYTNMLVWLTLPKVIKIIYILTSWSLVFLENLTCCQLIQKSPTLYRTLNLTTTFTRYHRWSQSWTTKFHSLSPIPQPEDPFQYHSLSYARVFQWFFPTGCPTNKICAFNPLPQMRAARSIHSSWFKHPKNI